MKANVKNFVSINEALAFMTELGPDRVISVHARGGAMEERFLVWYWE